MSVKESKFSVVVCTVVESLGVLRCVSHGDVDERGRWDDEF